MKKIIYSLLALLTMASCAKSSSEDTLDDWSGELRISSGIETRASGTTWESGDEIGLFMSETGTYNAVGIHNTKYVTTSTTSSAIFTVDSENYSDLYYPQSTNVDIVAHYPFNSSATVLNYSVDVTDQTDLTAIDFMSAKMVNIAKSKTALDLKFYHMLSQLKVALTPADNGGLTAADLASATITVSGTKVAATATLNYDTQEEIPTAAFSLSGDATALSMAASSGAATFMVVPQTADVTFTITLSDGSEFYVTASNVALSSGDEHAYTISVSKTAAKIEGATISPWGTGAGDSLDASDYVVPDIELVDGTYLINTAAGLWEFAAMVDDGNTEINVTLVNNIDLKSVEWTPIGTSDKPFSGTFDGDGYTISGLCINATSEYQGLIGYMDGNSSVSNLTVDGSVTSTESSCGGIVGYASSSDGDIIIENCVNNATIKTDKGAHGGIIGYAGENVYVNNCYNSGTIIGGSYIEVGEFSPMEGELYYSASNGGVVGSVSNAHVSNCYNSGSVIGDESGSNSIGGVVGSAYGASAVSNCYNIGAVTGGVNVGGILGYSSSSVDNCYNTGTVTSASNGGGVVGAIIFSSVDNCYWLDTSFSGSGVGYNYSSSTSDLESKSESEMQTTDFVTLLNNGGSSWMSDYATPINSGYPILSWQF